MSVSYINKLLTREEFFLKSYKKGNSKGYENLTRSVITDVDRFCEKQYSKKTDDVVIDLKKDLDDTNDPGLALKFLQDYIDWLDVDHPDVLIKWNLHQKKGRPLKKKIPLAIRNYVSRVRKFLKMCGGIRIDDGDYGDYLTFPADDNDEEPEPLRKAELRLIIDSATTPKRKAMYMFMKDTRARILETMRVKKKYIDLNTNPVTVTLPKSIVKGKKMKRVLYLTRETTPGIRQLLKDLDDEDLVFATNSNDMLARDNEEHVWNRLMRNLKFNEKYENGFLKKNLHSIGAFCITQIKEATKDADYAHGYGGHTQYLHQYIRLTDERKIELFRQAEPYLSIYDNTVLVDESQELKEIKEKLEKYKVLDDILDNLSQPKLEELLQNLSKH